MIGWKMEASAWLLKYTVTHVWAQMSVGALSQPGFAFLRGLRTMAAASSSGTRDGGIGGTSIEERLSS